VVKQDKCEFGLCRNDGLSKLYLDGEVFGKYCPYHFAQIKKDLATGVLRSV